MWRNYLTVGFRAMTKNKTYAFINILGLALGLAACLILLLYVRYETSYDEWLPNSERLYQLQTHPSEVESGDSQAFQITSFSAAEAVRKDFPQVEKLVYALPEKPILMERGTASTVEDVLFVDGLFFDLLQFPFVRGEPGAALLNPGTVVLTESEAVRLFGAADPIGRTLTLVNWGKPIDHRVTGVVKDPPKNSHLDFKMVARFDPASFFADSPDILSNWGWQSGFVYLKLKPGADHGAIDAALAAWEKRNIPDQNADGMRSNLGDGTDWKLVNVADVHLGEAQSSAMTPGNDRQTIVTFAIVAALILGIAAINFINLATARATQRAREVAVRKVLGASRRQLIAQFLGESVLLTAVAMLLALTFVELSLPIFSDYLDASLSFNYFGDRGLIVPVVALVLVVGGLGGLYPAFYLSRFQPAKILKANKSSTEAQGSGRLRSALVAGQFAVSIGLIACTAVVYWQTNFARETDPGYRRDGIVQVSGFGSGQIGPVKDALLNAVRDVEGVTAIGRSSIGVGTKNSSNTLVQVPGSTKPVQIGNYPIDPGFFDAMGIELVAGRSFDERRPMDDASLPYPSKPDVEAALASRGVNIVVNALAAKMLGFAEPANAVGKQVKVALVDPEHGLVPATIIGVAQDSRFRSIREPVDPILFRNSRFEHQYLIVRYEDANPAAMRERLQAVWKRLVPQVPFEAAFSEDIVGELYESEEARAQTFAAFAALAILIACLGLFGLAAFTAERRTKEIGIRKVFGATVPDIVQLLAWQFSKPVIVANLIAWPVAWWVMRDWLNGFDARIDLGPAPFLLAGALALAVAVGTVTGHTVRIARLNPIHALRYE